MNYVQAKKSQALFYFELYASSSIQCLPYVSGYMYEISTINIQSHTNCKHGAQEPANPLFVRVKHFQSRQIEKQYELYIMKKAIMTKIYIIYIIIRARVLSQQMRRSCVWGGPIITSNTIITSTAPPPINTITITSSSRPATPGLASIAPNSRAASSGPAETPPTPTVSLSPARGELHR